MAAQGHPIDTFQRENQALLQVTASCARWPGRIGDAAARPMAAAKPPWRLAGTLREMDRHYLRKENQLFPFLEEHGVEGPSKVMWALHDDVRTRAQGDGGGGRRPTTPAAARRRRSSSPRRPTTW